MKTKSFGKKLLLNKKTVANLEQKEMRGIYGGETDRTVCDTNCVSECPLCITKTRCTNCCHT